MTRSSPDTEQPLTGAALARWCYEHPCLAARTIEGLRAPAQAEQERTAELQYEAGMYKSLYEAAIARSSEGTATPNNDGHYLSAIRKRLEQLYDASADNPRLREHLSDEVDWLDEQLGTHVSTSGDSNG